MLHQCSSAPERSRVADIPYRQLPEAGRETIRPAVILSPRRRVASSGAGIEREAMLRTDNLTASALFE